MPILEVWEVLAKRFNRIDMEISNLSSLIEILAVANIGYASSSKFRNIIAKDIIKLTEYIDNKRVGQKEILQEINANIIEENGSAATGSKDSFFNRQFEQTKFFIKEADEHLNKLIKNHEKVINGLNYNFLLSGVYCIYILIFLSTTEIFNSDQLKNHLIILNLVIPPFIAFIFIRSYIPRWYDSDISPTILIIMCILPLILMFIVNNYLTNEQNSVSNLLSLSNGFLKIVIIIMACSAILLSYFRDISHRSIMNWMPRLINKYTLYFSIQRNHKKALHSILASENFQKFKAKSIKSFFYNLFEFGSSMMIMIWYSLLLSKLILLINKMED